MPTSLRSTLATAVVAIALSSPSLAAQAPTRAIAIARIDSIVNSALAAPFSGFSVAVVKGRDTLVMKGYGSANLELSTPVTPATVFRIGSVTKQFTSAAIMQLVDQGKIGLDDLLSKHMPNVPAHWQGVTIRHLLNHTSGIPSYTDVGPRVRAIFVTGVSRDSLIALLRGDSLVFEPGKGFYYNNTGYYLLGMLIEKLSGKTYAAYVADHLAKPLGLEHTMYCSTGPVIAGRASGYDRQGTALVNASYIDMDIPYAAGSLCSSARDLVKWGAALASGRVVRAESYREMTTPMTLASARRMTYGFGLAADTMAARRVVSHGGNVNGFAADLTHLPDDSLFVAVLSNTSSAPSSRIASDIARAILGVSRVAFTPRDVPVTAAERTAIVGRYLLAQPDGSRREVAMVEQEGRLALSIPGQAPLLLQREAGAVFTVRGQPTARVLMEMLDGRVTGLIFDRGGRPLPARRIP